LTESLRGTEKANTILTSLTSSSSKSGTHRDGSSQLNAALSLAQPHCASCLFVAHVSPFGKSVSDPEKALCESRCHSIINRYFPFTPLWLPQEHPWRSSYNLFMSISLKSTPLRGASARSTRVLQLSLTTNFCPHRY